MIPITRSPTAEASRASSAVMVEATFGPRGDEIAPSFEDKAATVEGWNSPKPFEPSSTT